MTDPASPVHNRAVLVSSKLAQAKRDLGTLEQQLSDICSGSAAERALHIRREERIKERMTALKEEIESLTRRLSPGRTNGQSPAPYLKPATAAPEPATPQTAPQPGLQAAPLAARRPATTLPASQASQQRSQPTALQTPQTQSPQAQGAARARGLQPDPPGAVRLTATPPLIDPGLFTPRPRPRQNVLPPGARGRLDKIYLPVPDHVTRQVSELGARIGPKGGIYIMADDRIEQLDPYLPFFWHQQIIPLAVDLIPQTSFGGSLGKLLTSTTMEHIRQAVFAPTGGLCRLCGMNGYGNRANSFQALWEYYQTPEGTGIQRMSGLLTCCTTCKDIFALGLAGLRGRSEEAFNRIAWLNRWDESEIETYYTFIADNWRRRSQINWDLDLSYLTNYAPLNLKTAIDIREDGELIYPSDGVSSGRTRIVGVTIGRNNSEIVGPFPLPDYRLVSPA